MISVEEADKLKNGFGERLKRTRISQGLTQRELANRLNITNLATYNRYEKLNAQPSISLLVRMASALDVTTDELIGYNPHNAMTDTEKAIRTLKHCGIYVLAERDTNNMRKLFIDNKLYKLTDGQFEEAIFFASHSAKAATEMSYYQIYKELFKRFINLVQSSE